MSRLGRMPINIPSGVQVRVDKTKVHVKGPKGELSRSMEQGIDVKVEDNKIVVTRKNDERLTRSKHGMYRTLLNNMVVGVTRGFQKSLEISGVGFRAQVQGRNINFALGFSHPTVFALPAGIEATVEKQTMVTIKGNDKYWVGQVAAQIRGLKPPEPYKGKGIKYAGEVIVRKEGKTGK